MEKHIAAAAFETEAGVVCSIVFNAPVR